MAYGYCTIANPNVNGGTPYVFPYNPVESVNPGNRIIAETVTLAGRYQTDWGFSSQRQDISLKWPVLPADFYNTLQSYGLSVGTSTFVDEFGTSYTVGVLPPTYSQFTPRADAYQQVQIILKVVSSP